jgi:hypothetical protein
MKTITRSKRLPQKSGGPATCCSLPMTMRAFEAVLTLDEKFLGTADYMGVAYWWGYAYRHYLRAATGKERKRAHDGIVAAGLPLDGESKEHAAIVEWATNNGRRACEQMGVKWRPYTGPRPAKRKAVKG